MSFRATVQVNVKGSIDLQIKIPVNDLALKEKQIKEEGVSRRSWEKLFHVSSADSIRTCEP